MSGRKKGNVMTINGYTAFLLLLTVHGSIQKSTPESSTYRAAVVDMVATENRRFPQKAIDDNVRQMERFVKHAANQNVDIIVFPEGGLNSLRFPDRLDFHRYSTVIPSPHENFTPCTNISIPAVSDALKDISCIAARHKIYVVVDVIEKEVCTGCDCASDGLFIYITNVVFDREGKIIARARKSHQYNEYVWFNVTRPPRELSTFETDFGVTFGTFVCYDIFFEDPALNLTRQLNITDIVFSHGWFAELPFAAPAQFQSGWAYKEDVNLLASGYNRAWRGYGGSGIYGGRQGIITAVQPFRMEEKILIADVPKKNKKVTTTPFPKLTKREDGFTRHKRLEKRDYENFGMQTLSLVGYSTKIIANDGYIEDTLTSNRIKCEFALNFSNPDPPTTYRFVAYDGTRPADNHFLGVRTCVIVQCSDETLDSCGHFWDTPATFVSIVVTATTNENKRTLLMPSTLGTDLLPLDHWSYTENNENGTIRASISLKKPTQNIITFGIWGRNFEDDSFPKSAGSRISNRLLFLPFILLSFKYLFDELSHN
ncbi:vanin-like protein 1 [Athalia rosae]|uniref:vanin-like protein 1 n=1 Tax=Athalia rosae TaxID=37344 RepID=UPI002033C074|nr:vanin-like protein 1 [Athalia rosae]